MSFRVTALAAAAALGVVGIYEMKTNKPKQEAVVVIDSARVVVVRTPGGLLEVAALTRSEEFAWSTRYQCPLIDCSGILHKTVSRVRVPVHYVYRVPLAENWELTSRPDHYELTVPALEPEKPVAIDTAKLQIESTRGWLTPPALRNERALMQRLGPELEQRGGKESYLALAQPQAAKTVEEFARKWMAEQGLSAGKPIRVQFRSSP